MLKTDFDTERLIITTGESGGNVNYNYEFFKEDFEKWCNKLDVFIAKINHLKQYLIECGYNVIEIKEVKKC